MRLLKLKVKNIASLKGEHEIDFEAIGEAGSLFAITGETGSGKSTILNCIGLALYGKIYKQNVTQVDVVTLGEKEGQIELSFSSQGKSYLAHWVAKVRRQNGELLKKPDIQRDVYPIENGLRGSPIESTERLLNLDFDQFCKCSILNQGEFARFLSSSFTERKAILEKLYPGELLDNLGKELKRQLDSLEKEKSELEIKLGELGQLTEDGDLLLTSRERLKSELAMAESWTVKLGSLDTHFHSLREAWNKYHQNRARSTTIKTELARIAGLTDQILKDHDSAQADLSAARAIVEKEAPRLQELIKLEEGLRHEKRHFSESQVLQARLESDLTALSAQLEEGQRQTSIWSSAHKCIEEKFQTDISALKLHQEAIMEAARIHSLILSEKKVFEVVSEALTKLEVQGKETAASLARISERLRSLPENPELALKDLETQRFEAIRLQEQVQYHETTLADWKLRTQDYEEKHKTWTLELRALETNLKLSDLNDAIELCLKSAHDACPVCETRIAPEKWKELLGRIKMSDMEAMRARSEVLSRLLVQNEESMKLANKEMAAHSEAISLKAPKLKPVSEEEIKKLRDLSYEVQALKAEEQKYKADIERARADFLKTKQRGQELSSIIQTQEEAYRRLQGQIGPGKLEEMMADVRHLPALRESESLGEKLQQEKIFRTEKFETKLKDKASTEELLRDISKKVESLELILSNELQGQIAEDRLATIKRAQTKAEERARDVEKQKNAKENEWKGLQGQLYLVEEQLKAYDLQFTQTIHAIRDEALSFGSSPLDTLMAKLSVIQLNLDSTEEMFISLKAILTEQKGALKSLVDSTREALAQTVQKLTDWEKCQKKMKSFKADLAHVTQKLSRLDRLGQILGQDNLRTFVLSLVEENLIIQTNEELEKLAQGRYQIVHQTRGAKISPEFYIMDKFLDGGLRKVSTLSGGETFMVSLAMALGLAEMTRGQAEIDSLFIDEGFGTLDQDSLEDVLEMLNQIQTRGLMVGVISHIKTLTEAIPVNLKLVKKSDGSSTLHLVYN